MFELLFATVFGTLESLIILYLVVMTIAHFVLKYTILFTIRFAKQTAALILHKEPRQKRKDRSKTFLKLS